MGLLPTIVDKLDPLVRRLASDKDGERLACVAVIERQLDRAGLTFHDLADPLTAPEIPTQRHDAPVFHDYAAAVDWLLASDGDPEARELLRLGVDPAAMMSIWRGRTKCFVDVPVSRWAELTVEESSGGPVFRRWRPSPGPVEASQKRKSHA